MRAHAHGQVRLLLARGADVYAINADGEVPVGDGFRGPSQSSETVAESVVRVSGPSQWFKGRRGEVVGGSVGRKR